MAERGNPDNVRIGPGKLYIAPLDSTEPTDLDTDWDAAWTLLGYTETGSTFVNDQVFEDIEVAEEVDPLFSIQTRRTGHLDFALAEITARHLEYAFNGGTVDVGVGITTYEPPPAGEYTHVMLGWEAEDGFERMVFRKCLQTGSVSIARAKAPRYATIPVSFRVLKPASGLPWKRWQDTTYAAGTSS